MANVCPMQFLWTVGDLTARDPTRTPRYRPWPGNAPHLASPKGGFGHPCPQPGPDPNSEQQSGRGSERPTEGFGPTQPHPPNLSTGAVQVWQKRYLRL
jgi:hypothetical protein